jgi:hypothetical protein
MWAAEAKLSKDIDLGLEKVVKGTKVTITQGYKYEYAIWYNNCLWDTSKEFIDEPTIDVLNKFVLK